MSLPISALLKNGRRGREGGLPLCRVGVGVGLCRLALAEACAFDQLNHPVVLFSRTAHVFAASLYLESTHGNLGSLLIIASQSAGKLRAHISDVPLLAQPHSHNINHLNGFV